MSPAIRVGDLTVTFHKTRHETDGAFDLYEMTIPVGSRMFMPHFHRDYDETIMGIDGISHWVLDGRHIEIGPGEELFIKRGTVHSVVNLHQSAARVMCLITPGKLGPEYFQELAAVAYNSDQPNSANTLADAAAVMARYGVIPVTL